MDGLRFSVLRAIKGGKGSGFKGHAGRPGKRGGSAKRALTPMTDDEVARELADLKREALAEQRVKLPAPQNVTGQFWLPNRFGTVDFSGYDTGPMLELGGGTYLTSNKTRAYEWFMGDSDVHETVKPITIKDALVMTWQDYYKHYNHILIDAGFPSKFSANGDMLIYDAQKAEKQYKEKYHSPFDTDSGHDLWEMEMRLDIARLQAEWFKNSPYKALILTRSGADDVTVWIPPTISDQDAVSYIDDLTDEPWSGLMGATRESQSVEPSGPEYFNAWLYPFSQVRDDRRTEFSRRAAEWLGFTEEMAEKLVSYSPTKKTFWLGGERLNTAGEFYPDDGEIVIYEEAFSSRRSAFGVVAHEIGHAKFDALYKDFFANLELFGGDDESYDEYKEHSPDTTPEQHDARMRELIETKIARFTSAQYFVENNPYKHGHTPGGEALIRNDGVSEYSAKYWTEYEKDPSREKLTLAINETLAEIDRITLTLALPGSGLGSGDKLPGPEWKEFHSQVNRHWRRAGFKQFKQRATGTRSSE